MTQYQVVAMSGDGGASGPSNAATSVLPLLAPTYLSATAMSASEIDLEWQDNSAMATSLQILRSTNGGAFTWIATLPDPTTTTFADTSGLTPGTSYGYEIKAWQGSLSSDPSTSASDTTTPAVPTGLSAAAVSASEVDLTWPAVAGATGYDVQREISGSFWYDIAQVTGVAGTNTYADTSVLEGTDYTYRINASNNSGASDFSASAGATTPLTLPNAPQNLHAIATGPGTIQLVWQNDAYNEDYFIVEHSETGGTDDADWSSIGETDPGVTKFTDGDLGAGATWYYRVIAANAAGNSDPSNTASATTNSITPTPLAPPPPTILSVTFESPDVPHITYIPGIGGGPVTDYLLQRSYDGNTGIIQSQDSVANAFDDGFAFYGVDYTYQVIAVGPGGQAASASVGATLPLVAPTSAELPDIWVWADGQTVTFHHDFTNENPDPQTAITGFKIDIYAGIYYFGQPVPGAPIASVTGNGPDAWATVHGLPDGLYSADVMYFNAAGQSESGLMAPEFTVQRQSPGAGPTLTTSFDGSTLTPAVGGGQSLGIVEYSADGSDWIAGGGSGNYYVAPGASGYIRASGSVGGGPVGYSNTISVSGATLEAPTGLTATPGGTNTVHLVWNAIAPLDSSQPAVGGNVWQTIEIERSDDGGAHFHFVNFVSDTTTSYDDALMLDHAYTYIYRIRIVGSANGGLGELHGYSAYSATASAKTYCLPPTNINVMAGATELDFTWMDVNEGETSTELQLSTDPTFATGVISGSVGPDVTSFNFFGLAPSTNYYYRIQCLPNGTSESDWAIGSVETIALPVVTISKVLDAADASPDGTPSVGYFEFTRTGDTSLPLTVNYTVDTSAANAATAGDEYETLSGVATIAAGANSVLVAVVPTTPDAVVGTTTVTEDTSSEEDYTTDEEQPAAEEDVAPGAGR